jgi:acetolactate synthase-1/2/3 large subunit
MPEMVKLSDYVIRRIAEQGVKHVFMLPGGGAMHLNDSLGKCPDIEYVCNLHEQASAIAAEAYARVTNNLGVCMVTSGPGGTNAITGVAAAWLDSTPTLFLSGQVKRADLKRDTGVRQLGVQEVDIVSIVRPITKYAVTVTEPESIRYHFEQALYLARSGRRGPVWLDIPLDVQAVQVDVASLEGFQPPKLPVKKDLPRQVAEVVRWLGRAARPVVLAGNGIRASGAVDEFQQLAERLGIPVLTTWLGIDLIADSHPPFAGRPGSIAPRGANFAIQNSDLLIVVGSRLDMAMIGYAPQRLARAAKKVMVDLDPAETEKLGGIIDLPIHADVKAFLQELSQQTKQLNSDQWTAWVSRCREWKQKYPLVLDEHRAVNNGVSSYCLSDTISDELASDDLVVTGSSGNAVELFLLAFRSKAGQRVFHARGLGSMGFGLPASIGACLASGRERTICLDGDGGFQMNIQELETVRRLNLPIKFFVVNNDGYASIRASQGNYFKRLVAADHTSGLTLPDLAKVAAAYGLPAVRITDQRDLRKQVRAVLEAPGPVVCEVLVPADEPRGPRLSSMQRADGSIVSKPLEDLWPFLDREEFLANMLIPPLDEN